MTDIKPALAAKIDAVIAVLKDIEQNYSPAVLASSYGAEDMVLTDLICKHAQGIEIFTLDTGRLPKETYELMQQVQTRYDKKVQVFLPGCGRAGNLCHYQWPECVL
jgi:phosphoadenosine phosphosulfate reductase